MILSRVSQFLSLSFNPYCGVSIINWGRNCVRKNQIIVAVRCITVYERNVHGREFPYDEDEKEYSLPELCRLVWKHGRKEFKMFFEEVRDHLRNDPKIFTHGDTDVIFKFDSEECLEKWKLGFDKRYNEGFSECSLIINNQGKGVFSGTIDTIVPKDGKLKLAGYCCMRSKKLLKSFARQDHYYWEPFTHLELRVRGDGRTYGVHLGIGNYYDVTWLDLYTYFLFTHGGPYWQTVRIPFSKFFLNSKSRIQDKQGAVPKNRIDSVGILCANVPGPFKLEIDYIGVHVDWNELEKFAYEMYKIPQYYVSS